MIQTSTTSDTNTAIAAFDAAGNKVATKVNDIWRFLIYDAFGKLVSEYGGLNSNDEGGVKYIHQDIQGSTRCVTSVSGAVISRMDYQAFGEQLPQNIGQRTASGFGSSESLRQRYGLTERDEATGLDDTPWRKHENRAGRWTSPDPYKGSMSLGNPQSFNRFSYVENQPTNFVDPTGLLVEGELCQLNGQVNPDGSPIYQGTVVNGRCQSHAGSPVQVIWINTGLDPFDTPDPINNHGGFGGGGGAPGSNAAIATNSCAVGAGLLEFSKVRNGQWFGNNSVLGLTKGNRLGWGGNGATGARAGAIRTANAFKVIGRAAFGIGTGITLYQVYYGEISPGKGAVDIAFSAIGTFGGPPGLVIGATYFIVDATVGWDSVGNALAYKGNERNTNCARQMLTNRLGPPR